MSARTILLWRHGQTDYNVRERLQGQVDIPLNDVGRAQAEAAADVLAQRAPALIVSSDLSRAAATAAALSVRADVPVALDVRLRERNFGAWEGLTHAEVKAGWPEQYRVWRAGGHPEGIGAERRGAVGERVREAIEEHADAVPDGGVLVVVSHGAAIGAGIASLLGQDPDSWHGVSGIGNCHWSILQPARSDVAPRWRLVAHDLGVPDDFTPGV